ncbi:MAG: ribosome-associated translation inhibitor RaiA [Tissierellia bacterium]|nr:ribosome-associated translation inhibitor RaiA [Tissierellia bacterium]
MKLNIIGKNMDVNDNLKEVANKKLEKLNKFFSEDIKGDAVFKTIRNNKILEVTIYLPDGAVLRSEQSTNDMYNSIDRAVAQLDRQIRKHKTKLQKKYRNSDTIRFDRIEEYKEEVQDEIDTPKIVREKTFALRPMSKDEAALQMELVTHDFFLFLDEATNQVSVIYKRGDGHYGVLQADV